MANQIRCAHILVEKESVAKDILERVKKGESFAKLAEQYSIDGSRRRGGDLGFFGKGVMVKPFEEAAFALEKGMQDTGMAAGYRLWDNRPGEAPRVLLTLYRKMPSFARYRMITLRVGIQVTMQKQTLSA